MSFDLFDITTQRAALNPRAPAMEYLGGRTHRGDRNAASRRRPAA